MRLVRRSHDATLVLIILPYAHTCLDAAVRVPPLLFVILLCEHQRVIFPWYQLPPLCFAEIAPSLAQRRYCLDDTAVRAPPLFLMILLDEHQWGYITGHSGTMIVVRGFTGNRQVYDVDL